MSTAHIESSQCTDVDQAEGGGIKRLARLSPTSILQPDVPPVR